MSHRYHPRIMKAKTDDEDARAFAEAMRGVRRKPGAVHVTLDGRALSTRPRQREQDDRAVLQEMLMDVPPDDWESGDTLSYRAEGVQDGVMRKLRRGFYRIEGELDLHGLNRDRAREAVSHFLADCTDRRARCVRIVHGKGLGSPNSGPVLKNHLSSWLRRRRGVLAYCSARPADGGTGAVYVLLRTGV
jgi:DNA-nicking Smr family endonuclease